MPCLEAAAPSTGLPAVIPVTRSDTYKRSLALDAKDTESSAFLNQAEIGARQRLCPSIPLRLLLKHPDRLTNLRGIFPTGAGALLEHPTTRGTNTKAQFGIGEGVLEFSINHLALLRKVLQLAGDLHSPIQ